MHSGFLALWLTCSIMRVSVGSTYDTGVESEMFKDYTSFSLSHVPIYQSLAYVFFLLWQQNKTIYYLT